MKAWREDVGVSTWCRGITLGVEGIDTDMESLFLVDGAETGNPALDLILGEIANEPVQQSGKCGKPAGVYEPRPCRVASFAFHRTPRHTVALFPSLA